MVKRKSRILFCIKCKILIKTILRKMFVRKKECTINSTSINKKARWFLNYKYDCTKPQTFNEYIGWLKNNYRNSLWSKCADKLLMKKYLAEKGLRNFTAKTLATYTSIDEVSISSLPDKFVVKTNHDSGSVFICEKGKTDIESIFKKAFESIKHNYGYTGEWVYSDIKPVVFVEEYLEPLNSKTLIDYKFFIYNGKFKWGFTAQGRNVDCRFSVFEEGFEIQPVDYIYLRPSKKELPVKPLMFDEMVSLAEQIGEDFDFVRVDFFETKNGLVIGELTFFSQDGLGAFSNKKYDFKYGSYFKENLFARNEMCNDLKNVKS